MKKLNTIIGFLKIVKGLIVVGGLAALLIMIFMDGGETTVDLGDPYVYLKSDQSEALDKLNGEISSLIETESEDVYFKVNRLEMQIPATTGFKVFISLLILVTVGYTFYVIDLIQKIIYDVKSQEPFKMHNTDRVKRIGLLVMLVPFTEWVLQHAFKLWLSMNYTFTSSDSSMRISIGSESSYGWTVFILGLLIYTLGYAFAQGEKFQKENELTI